MTCEIWWIFTQPLKSLKISFWSALFVQSIQGLQIYRGVIFHDTEYWCKTWINPGLVVSKLAWGIGWTFIRALKSVKNCTLMDFFCPKHIMFQLENVIGIKCHDTEGNAKFNGKLTCSLKNDIRDLVNFHASSRKSENLHFDGIVLSKAYKVLDDKVQKSCVSQHWRVMESLKKNWLLVQKMTWRI